MLKLPVLLEAALLKLCSDRGVDAEKVLEKIVRSYLYEQAELARVRARAEREKAKVRA